MGQYAEELIEQEMFGRNKIDKREPKGNWKRTPSERKIASIRKEIAINIKNGVSVQEARKNANLKYGKGWRERGLISNSTNQWSQEDLAGFS